MTKPTIEITEAVFEKDFPLRRNHFDQTDAWNGCYFDTHGEQVAFVRKQDSRKIWTIVEDDNGVICIRSGFHLVNRLGYLISLIAIPEGADYWVTLG